MHITAFPALTGLLALGLIGFIKENTPVWIPCKILFLSIAMLAGFFMATPRE